MDASAGYPFELCDTTVLADGTRLQLRPILDEDAPRLLRLFDRLSADTLYRRFASPVSRPRLDVLAQLVAVDHVDRLALVALVDDEIVGVARYARVEPPDEAEAAVLVEDAWQGRGIGGVLLRRLAGAAQERGIRSFVAEVQGENRRMMGLLSLLAGGAVAELRNGGYEVRVVLSDVPGERR